MRKIEKQMLQAIEQKKDMSVSNTSVTINESNNTALVRLFGNLICVHDYNTGKRRYSSAGWPTATTCSRLNALGASVCRRGYALYNYPDMTPFKNEL